MTSPVSRRDDIPEIRDLKPIRNRYTKVRGEPRFYKIFCAHCDQLIFIYQKDGIGRLLRCYIDRIHYPRNIDDRRSLVCTRCRSVIGHPMVYARESRRAFRMFQEKFRYEIE